MIAGIYSFIIAWLATGLIFAIPFAFAGAHRLPKDRPPLSFGARLLIIPGAALFWPLMLWRWLAARKQRTAP